MAMSAPAQVVVRRKLRRVTGMSLLHILQESVDCCKGRDWRYSRQRLAFCSRERWFRPVCSRKRKMSGARSHNDRLQLYGKTTTTVHRAWRLSATQRRWLESATAWGQVIAETRRVSHFINTRIARHHKSIRKVKVAHSGAQIPAIS